MAKIRPFIQSKWILIYKIISFPIQKLTFEKF